MYSCTPASSPARLFIRLDLHAAAARNRIRRNRDRQLSGLSSCAIVAWNVRTGTAEITFCDHFHAIAAQSMPSGCLRRAR